MLDTASHTSIKHNLETARVFLDNTGFTTIAETIKEFRKSVLEFLFLRPLEGITFLTPDLIFDKIGSLPSILPNRLIWLFTPLGRRDT
jgi:hypothetical protein